MGKYPLIFNAHIMIFVNKILEELFLSIFHDMVFKFIILIYDSYLIVGLELLGWIYWKYDYP